MIGVELQRALDAFPLDRWVAEHGFEQGGRSHEWSAPCPRCAKAAKLVVNVQRRRWHCWVCQRKEQRSYVNEAGIPSVREVTVEGGGGLLKLIAWFYGCTAAEACRWILRVSNPGPLSTAQLPDLEAAAGLLASAEVDDADRVAPAPPDGASPLTADNLSYLRARGLGEGVARAYGIFSCVGGRYNRRVVFPTWGPRGELLYWQARATWDPALDAERGHVKAMNPQRPKEGAPPELTSEHVLGNLHRAAVIGGGRIALTEGPISGIKAGDDGTWTHGKQITAAHVALIVRAGIQAVDVMYDGPSEKEPHGARDETIKAVEMLSLFVPEVRAVWIPWGDPGDYDRETNAKFRAAAQQSAQRQTRLFL